MRGDVSVTFHGLLFDNPSAPGWIARQVFLQPDLPLRIETRRAFRSHPGRESFVEPKIIPPRHGDEIAKPLMCDLVRDHFINGLFGRG